MAIYTKTGDKGTTALFGGRRITKSDPRLEAYGTIDELTSLFGLIIAKLDNKKEQAFLTNIQKTLYGIMGALAMAKVNLRTGQHLLGDLPSEVVAMEKQIDTMTKNLPPLTRFVLPQGNELVALYHVARSVCRRSERRVVALGVKVPQHIVQYLNRLSDLLFTYARYHARGKEITT